MRDWTPPNRSYYVPRGWSGPTRPTPEPLPLDQADDPISANDPVIFPTKPSLTDIPTRRYSKIVPAELVIHKLAPKPLSPMADVEYMDWEFDEPQHEDDHELRVYVSLSREDIAIVKRWGYQHDVFEQIPLFEE